MKRSKDDIFREAMLRHGVSTPIVAAVLNDVFGMGAAQQRVLDTNDAAFAALLADVRHARRVVTGNRTKWHPDLVPLYEEYVELLDKACADITSARLTLVPDPENPGGPHIAPTLAHITRTQAQYNRRAKAEGFPLKPACTAVWTSWVAPADITRMVDAFDMAYVNMSRGRGQRFYPFVTTATRSQMRNAIRTHRNFIDVQRGVVYATHVRDSKGRVSNLYGALHLAALRQAELWLDKYEADVKTKALHPALNLVPVNWGHMLTPDMRQRLRAADEDPSSITPDGLTSFLRPANER